MSTTPAELEAQSPAAVPDSGDEKTSPDPDDLGDAPDGGLRAWLVAAGGSAIFFCCLGFSNSFGTFQEYYMRHQLRGESPDKVAWIGSISAWLQFAGGVAGGPLFDRFGVKVVRPAAVLYVISMMMLSLCKEYWQIMLVQGVLMGITMGFLQFPAFAAVSQYFDKKRAAALGIVVSGSSLGGIAIPIALSKMLNSSSLGYGWSVRVVGFLVIPFMLFACAVVRPRLPPTTRPFWNPAAFRDARFVMLIASCFFLLTGMFTPLFFLPTYAVSRGMGATLAGYLLAILNAASTFGRIIPGVLADRYGRLNMLTLGGFGTGITIFCLDAARTNAAMIVYAVFIGFTSGTIISGASTAISICAKDPRDIGTYLGMGMFLAAMGVLIGPPVNGAFLNAYGGFFEASMFSGSLCVFGAMLGLVTKALTKEGIFGKV